MEGKSNKQPLPNKLTQETLLLLVKLNGLTCSHLNPSCRKCCFDCQFLLRCYSNWLKPKPRKYCFLQTGDAPWCLHVRNKITEMLREGKKHENLEKQK